MAEGQNDGQERSQSATPRKPDQLRTDGQVPRSQDMSTTGLLLAVASGLLLLGPGMVRDLSAIMSTAFATSPKNEPDVLIKTLYGALMDAAVAVAPLMAVAAVAAILSPLLVGGWVLSSKPLHPDFSKLDPIKGITKRVFTVRGLVEMPKAGAKFLFVGTVAVILIRWQLPANLALSGVGPMAGLEQASWTIGLSFLALSAVMIAIAAVDVPFQKWNFARQNRMSFDEIKRENRSEEGAPELRAKVRAMQLEIAQRRMMEAVGDADVVITNPTHYAVALSYDPSNREAAPRLVASGADLVSWQIRQRAGIHGVPVVAAPGLARAVFNSTKLGQEIPFGLYAAVAIVLKYAYRLRGQPGFKDAPLPKDLPIPEELRFD